MANTETIDIQPVGISYEEPERGAFIKNCYRLPPNTWQVREGFGRVYSYNTSYNEISKDGFITPLNYGYVKHLGSCSFTTSFGNRQILSLHIAVVSSLNRDGADNATQQENVVNPNKKDVVSEVSHQYVVSIYDITTNRHYEQIITGLTSEIDEAVPMEQQTGFYDRDLSFSSNTKVFPVNPDAEESFYWAELNSPTAGDVIYFGTPLLGLYAYRPIVFDAPPDTQVETTLLGAYHYTLGGMMGRNGWSETPFIEKASAGEGILQGGFTYLNQTEFPVPTDITAINNRLALAYGRNVYFTDEFVGAAVISDNILEIPTDKEITAISEINGVLLIFTPTETYLYQPSVGTQIQTAGRLIKMNSNWGCLNSRSLIKAEDLLYWCDENSFYVSDGTKIEDIGDPIRPIFRRFMETPQTTYNRSTPNGWANPDELVDSPKIKYDWIRKQNLHFTKNPLNKLVMCVLPEQKVAFAIDNNKMMTLWSFEATNRVETILDGEEAHYIKNFSALADDFAIVDNDNDLFIIDLESKTYEVGALPQDNPHNIIARPVNVYQWKVGGALDFDQTHREDKKVYSHSLRVLQNEADEKTFAFAIGKPVQVYDGIQSDNGTRFGQNTANTTNGAWFLVPFGVSVQQDLIGTMNIDLTYDNTRWFVPTFPDGGIDYLDLIWHPNRLQTTLNFGWTAPAVGNRIYEPAAGNIVIEFNGATAPTFFGNNLNVLNQFQVLFWLPMCLKTPTTSSLGMGWGVNNATINGANAVVLATEIAGVERDSEHTTPYPVEWVLQPLPVTGDKGEQVKARGGFLSIFSHGPYTSTGVANNDRGLVNVQVSSNYNNYQGQIVDFTQTPPAIQDIDDVRDISAGSFTNSAGQLQPKVFNNPQATYADLTNSPTGGTVLVDGEEYYEGSFSTSTKGTSFFITLYGYAADIANRVLIKNISAAYRVVSQNRRRWRHNQGDK